MGRGRWRRKLGVFFVALIVLGLEAPTWGLTLEELRERGVVRFGVGGGDWGPFVSWRNEEPLGLCVDLGRALAAHLKLRDIFIPAPWGRGEPGSITGTWMAHDWSRFDVVVSPVAITADRSAAVRFSEPYCTVGQMIVVRREGGVTVPEHLIQGTIGVVGATTSEIAVRTFFPKASLKAFPTVAAALVFLRQGVLDAFVVDSPVAVPLVRECADLRALETVMARERYALTFPPGAEDALVEAVNAFLAEKGRALCSRWATREDPRR